MEEVLDKNGFKGKKLDWIGLPNAAGLDITNKDWNWRTV